MNVAEIPITSLIPQRHPFIMVDRITNCDKDVTYTEFVVQEDNIFLDNEELAVAGVIEHMAQSCAARMGIVNKMQNLPIYIGYIGDIKDFSISRLPKCNELLTTQINIIEQVFNLALASVQTKVGKEIIAEARMKIAQTDVVANI